MLIPRIIRKLACSGVRIHPRVLKMADSQSKNLYLTFDDGPHPKYTEQVLDLLSRHGIKATFFLNGDKMQRYGNIVSRVVREGHAIGNHTYSHKTLPSIGSKERICEIVRCQEVIDQLQGRHDRLFRPPAGLVGLRELRYLLKNGYRVAYWSVDSHDCFKLSSREIEARLNDLVKGGSVILFHDDTDLCLPALENLVPRWLSDGYAFLTF